MASAVWSSRFRRDPLTFLTGREICPGPRQSDQFLRQRVALSQDLYSKDLVGHFGCVNAIEFSHGGGRFLASGGDDRRVLIWNVEKSLSDVGKPAVLRGEHNSNIFCVAFDINNTNIFSGGNDEQVIVHDIETEETRDVFQHEDAVYGISPDPSNPHVFASSCGDGRVLIYDIRESTAEPFCLANYTSSMHAVMYNPLEPRLLATANAKEGLGLWDVRKPRSCLLRYGGSYVQQSCMSVRFNQRGDQLIALRRRLPPVLYRVHSNEPVCEFDHSGYYNSCTMKSICFAGDNDQYILSGSDEFNLYMWAVPRDLSERTYINSAHMVLKGHRSIVNQVRFNVDNHLVVSSGVEKIIKVWSPFRLPSKTDTSTKNVFRERPVYSHEEYINLVLQDGHVMSHDYSHESTAEDPRMMAFFDSLVQRELEGWSSDDSLSSNEEELYSRIVQMSQSDIDSDDSLIQPMLTHSDDEPSFSPFSIAFASVMASQAAGGNSRFPRLNAALERAERSSGANDNDTNEANEEESGDSSSDSASETNDRSSRERADTSANTQKRNIAKLVQKKKRDLIRTSQRRRKDCEAAVSSSSSCESCDMSELSQSDEDSSNLNLVIGEGRDLKACEGHLSQATRECLKVENDNKKQALQRLKKLRTLRENVMQENDTKELETISEAVTDVVASTSTAPPGEENTTAPPGEENASAVQFKVFKRRHSCSKLTAGGTDYKKSRVSPDQGPYLQKNATASVHDVHQASRDETSSSNKEKHIKEYSSESKGKHRSECKGKHRSECKGKHRSESKGKHRSILDHRHKRETGTSSRSKRHRSNPIVRHGWRDRIGYDRSMETHTNHSEHSCTHTNDTDERDKTLKDDSGYLKNKHKIETVSSSSGKECTLPLDIKRKYDKFSDVDKFSGDVDKFSGDVDKFSGDVDKFSCDIDNFSGDKLDTDEEIATLLSMGSPGVDALVYEAMMNDGQPCAGNSDSDTEERNARMAENRRYMYAADKIIEFDNSQESWANRNILRKSIRISDVDADSFSETSNDGFNKIKKSRTGKHRKLKSSTGHCGKEDTNDMKKIDEEEDVQSDMRKSICDKCGISMKARSVKQRHSDSGEHDVSLCRHCRGSKVGENQHGDSVKSPWSGIGRKSDEFNEQSHFSNFMTMNRQENDNERNIDDVNKPSCSYTSESMVSSVRTHLSEGHDFVGSKRGDSFHVSSVTDMQRHDKKSRKSKPVESEQRLVVEAEDKEGRSRGDNTARQERDDARQERDYGKSSKHKHGTDSSTSKHTRTRDSDCSKHHHARDSKGTNSDSYRSSHHSIWKGHGKGECRAENYHNDRSQDTDSKHHSTKSSGSKHHDGATWSEHSSSKHQSSDRHGAKHHASDWSESKHQSSDRHGAKHHTSDRSESKHRHGDHSDSKSEHHSTVLEHNRSDSSASNHHITESSESKHHSVSSESKCTSSVSSASQYRRYSTTSKHDSDGNSDLERHCSDRRTSKHRHELKHNSSGCKPGNVSESDNTDGKHGSRCYSDASSGSRHDGNESKTNYDASDKMKSQGHDSDNGRSRHKYRSDGSDNVRSMHTPRSDNVRSKRKDGSDNGRSTHTPRNDRSDNVRSKRKDSNDSSDNVRSKRKDSSDNGRSTHTPRSDSSDNVRSKRKDSSESSDNVRSRHTRSNDSSDDDAQPTWTEFKRFKSKLERARKHYKEHKHRRDSGD